MAAKKKAKTGRSIPSRPRETWWERLPSATQHGICLALLLALALGYFAPVLFSGKTLVGSDTVQWRATAESIIEHREATGEEPLWATNVFGGMPAIVISYQEQIPQIDRIATWLRTFAWPASHFIFLLLGTYLLVHFLTRNKWAGMLAASAFGLTTYLALLLFTGHNTKFVALCFAPWLILAFVYALRKPGVLSGLLFAVALAANLRADHVQITYYVTILIGVWWVVEGVGAWRRGEVRAFGHATGWLALGSVLGLLMIAEPYLLTYEYKAYSIRGASSGGGEGGLTWEYAMAWSQGWGEMITLLIADAFGGGPGTYWGPKPFTAGPHYVGGVVVLLAALALWRYRRSAVYALGISSVLMILFALGEHFEAFNRLMFAVLPLFDAFRVPETWLSVVALSLAALAGLGLFYVVRKEASPDAEQEKSRSVLVAAGAMVGLVALLLVGKNVFFDFERPGEFEQLAAQVAQQNSVAPDDPRVAGAVEQYLDQAKEERVDMYTDDAVRTLFVLLLAGGLLIAYRKEKVPAWVMQAGLVALVVVDVGGVGRRYFSEERLQTSSDVARQIRTYDFDQYILQQQEAAGGAGHFRVLSLEGSPTETARPSYHYESLSGYSAAKLRLYQDYLEHILPDPQTGLPNENALDLLNTRYIVAPQPLPGTEVVFTGEETGYSVLENSDAVPRAFFVGETEVIETPEALWARIQDETFDPHRTALLSEPIGFTTTPLDSASTAAVSLQQYGPREIVWQVETDAPRLLVVSEIYYPAGWTATVDGEEVPIHRADYLLRAVPIPAGQHEVAMRFTPPSYRLSLWISGISTLLVYGSVVALLGLAWIRRRKVQTEPEETSA